MDLKLVCLFFLVGLRPFFFFFGLHPKISDNFNLSSPKIFLLVRWFAYAYGDFFREHCILTAKSALPGTISGNDVFFRDHCISRNDFKERPVLF